MMTKKPKENESVENGKRRNQDHAVKYAARAVIRVGVTPSLFEFEFKFSSDEFKINLV